MRTAGFLSLMAVVVGLTGCEKNRSAVVSQVDGSGFVLRAAEQLGLKEASLEDLLRQGIFQFQPAVDTPRLSRTLFDAINASAAYSMRLGLNDANAVTRVDRYKLGQDIGNLRISAGGQSIPLPLRMSKGEEIQFVRVFSSPQQAAAAAPANLLSLPTTADKALELSEGTTVIIPSTTKVVASAPLRYSGNVQGLNVSAGLSARAVIEGSFRIQVTRGKGKTVRVRIAESSTDGVGFGAQANVGVPKPLKVLFFSKDLSAGGELSAEASRGMRFSADYELDLGKPSARDAYDKAISGRVVLSTADRLAAPWRLANETFTDFTGLDAAAEVSGGGVIQRSWLLDNYNARKAAISISAPWFAFGIEKGFSSNRITVEPEGGAPATYAATAHVFGYDNRSALFGGGDKKASGFLATEGALQSGLPGAHWFFWSRRDFAAGTLDSTLEEIRNALPPGLGLVPAELNLPNRTPNGMSMRIVLSEKAVSALFDARKTTPDVLGQALTNMARSFKVQFILPYNQMPYSPLTPRNIRESAVLTEACDVVSREWGRFYCDFFVKEFIPTLADLQQSSTAQPKAEFFKLFYTQGLGLNHFGGQVLVRYLSEVLSLVGMRDGMAAEASISWKNDRFDDRVPPTNFRVGAFNEPEVLGYVASALGM